MRSRAVFSKTTPEYLSAFRSLISLSHNFSPRRSRFQITSCEVYLNTIDSMKRGKISSSKESNLGLPENLEEHCFSINAVRAQYETLVRLHRLTQNRLDRFTTSCSAARAMISFWGTRPTKPRPKETFGVAHEPVVAMHVPLSGELLT